MSRPEDRRQAARILTEFPLVLHDEAGVLVDDRALAHDLSDKGFKIESNGALEKCQPILFRIQLSQGESMRGRGRVVWVERTDLALWAGAEFVALSWSDRRRLRRITRPSDVEWGVIFDKAIIAAFWLTVTLMVWGVLTSYVWRSVVMDLAPKAFATVVLGWALREMLRPPR